MTHEQKRITVDSVDITEHVAAMFDALVGSMDWGSGFLSVETIESILLVAELAGFEVPELLPTDPPGFQPNTVPVDAAFSRSASDRDKADRAEVRRRRWAAVKSWRAQVAAKAAAMRKGDEP